MPMVLLPDEAIWHSKGGCSSAHACPHLSAVSSALTAGCMQRKHNNKKGKKHSGRKHPADDEGTHKKKYSWFWFWW